ncbi:MAG: hypothetical protein NDI75_02150 [Candidatus Didemnitutus sp.]|nr:hypothetical protein [Candidatus Didemnitutus sp.]
MRRLTYSLFCCITLLGIARTEEAPFEPEYYTRQEWIAWRERMRSFDEIRMTLATKTVPLPVKWTGSGIKFEMGRVHDILVHKQEKINDPDSFITLLEFQPGLEKMSHGCRGLYDLGFYRKGELVGRLHYAHSRYWHPLTPKSQDELSRWLAARGFPIEEVQKRDR